MSDNDDLNLQELDIDGGLSETGTPVLASDEGEGEVVHAATDLEAVYDIPVTVSAVLGNPTCKSANF